MPGNQGAQWRQEVGIYPALMGSMNASQRTEDGKTKRAGRNSFRITLNDFSALSYEVIVGQAAPCPSRQATRAPRALPGSPGAKPCPDRAETPAAETSGRTELAVVLAPLASARRRRLLIADDTAGIRDSLAKLLRSEGYEVELAVNGREALDKFHPARFDLLLLDLDMPEVNGWEALERLMARYPEIAVIVITGKSEACQWMGTSRAGIVVEKPIDVGILLERIREALEETPGRRRERVDFQHKLIRHTRPLPDVHRRECFRHGGLND